jgi:hypothetical protein
LNLFEAMATLFTLEFVERHDSPSNEAVILDSRGSQKIAPI